MVNKRNVVQQHRNPSMTALSLRFGIFSLIAWSAMVCIGHPSVLAQEDLQDYDYWAQLCDSLTQSQSYEKAITACDRAIALNANDPKTWRDRGNALFALKNYPEAVLAYQKVLEFEPQNVEILTKRCEGLFQLSRYDQSLNDCESALEIADQAAETLPDTAWYFRGAGLQKQQKSEEALVALNWATQLHPDDSLAWATRCQALSDLNREAEAIASCQKALDTNGNWRGQSPGVAWVHLGDIYLKRQNIPAALDAYDKAIAFTPEDADLWTKQGQLLSQVGRDSEANASYQWAVTLNPESSFALINQCANLNQLEKYEDALVSCEKAFQEGDQQWGNRDAAFAWQQRGNALLGVARFAEALTSIDRALALDAKIADTWSARAATLWRLGRFEEALAATEAAVRINPASSLAWYNQGRIYGTLGELQKALGAYEQALKGDANLGKIPTLTDIWINHSAVLWRLKNYSLAVTSAQQALSLSPKDSTAWYNKALALMGLNNNTAALQAFEQAIAYDSTNSDYWTGKGIVLSHTKQYPEALEALKQAIALNPENALALTNQKRIMDLIQLDQ